MINAIGIIKGIDELGRIVIPKDFRERIGLEGEVEILLTEEGILVRSPKYRLVSKEGAISEAQG